MKPLFMFLLVLSFVSMLMGVSAEDDRTETLEIEEHRSDQGRDLIGQNATVCTNKLKSFAQYKLKTSRDYELVRDGGHKGNNVGNGPSHFAKNKLGSTFSPSCLPTTNKKSLSFLVKMPKNEVKHVGGCIAHIGSHAIEFPAVTVYDCHGNVIACGDGETQFQVPVAQNVLIVVTPRSNRRPDAYKFYFQKHKQFDLYCDYYPF